MQCRRMRGGSQDISFEIRSLEKVEIHFGPKIALNSATDRFFRRYRRPTDAYFQFPDSLILGHAIPGRGYGRYARKCGPFP
jgi:hypothetical protein